MASKPQMGLKINFQEYICEVDRVVDAITVKDLITKLWGSTKKLSCSSNIKDIIFLTQNLYTLGGLVVGAGVPIHPGPIKTILDRVATQHMQSTYPKDLVREDTQVTVTAVFNAPRFSLEPDLNEKQIRITMQVNGNPEELVMGYEEFFSEVLRAYGNRKLLAAIEA